MPLRKDKSKKRLLQVEKENLFKQQIGSVKEFEISLVAIRVYYNFSAPVLSLSQHQSQLQQRRKLHKNISTSPEKKFIKKALLSELLITLQDKCIISISAMYQGTNICDSRTANSTESENRSVKQLHGTVFLSCRVLAHIIVFWRIAQYITFYQKQEHFDDVRCPKY